VLADGIDAVATAHTGSDQAETLLMQTGAVCPLYWYTDTYLCNTHVQGLLSGPLGAQYLMGAHVEK
jgi:oligopeptide transport system substrate-binding protein